MNSLTLIAPFTGVSAYQYTQPQGFSPPPRIGNLQSGYPRKTPFDFYDSWTFMEKRADARLGMIFAKEGFFTCLFDACLHGELRPDYIKGHCTH